MYFPNVDEENGETTLKFGKFNLHYISEKPFEDFSIRTIECENSEVLFNLFILTKQHQQKKTITIKFNFQSKKKHVKYIISILQIGPISVNQSIQHHF